MSKQRKGDCYEAAVHFMMSRMVEDDWERYRLCHGLVVGQGGEVLGKTFDHAWVERRDDPPPNLPPAFDVFEWITCIDKSNGHDVSLLSDAYYALGQVNLSSIVRYTMQEMMENMAFYRHYGPWHVEKEKEQ